MTLGRPNIYRQIVEELGGKATVNQIFTHGSKHRMLNCTLQGCVASVRLNIRRGNLSGDIRAFVWLPEDDYAPHTRTKTMREAVAELLDRVAQLEQQVAQLTQGG